MDMILVSGAVALAIWYTAKYFYKLVKTPETKPVSCGGCHSSCHSDVPEIPTVELVRKLK